MLKLEKVSAFYGSIQALHEIDLYVGNNEIVALIGSNGAGKTTMLNAISGHVQTEGKIFFNDVDMRKVKSHKIAMKGILQVPEGRHVFPGLTVEQNLLMGTVSSKGFRVLAGDNEEDLKKIYKIFPRLDERKKQLAWSLSGGEQQMLAIGRALMGKPKMLMLDEPSMGLAPLIIQELFQIIVEINKSGTPILLVEQNAKLALEVSHRAYILDRGKINLSGESKDLISDPRVKEAYLGKVK